MNELTTVAAVFALSPYMISPTHIGSGTTDAAALNTAFGLATQLVSSSTGTIPVASTATATKLNTLADILAACINTTGGTAGDTSLCGKLFALTTPPTAAVPPSDTVSALLNIAIYPSFNVAPLYQLAPAISPFQPTLSFLPADLAIQQTPSANGAVGLQIGPASLTFPATSIGVSAPAQTVVISNPTSTAVTITGITVIGANPGDFSQITNCGATLAPSASCTVSITFSPGGSSARSASLSVASVTPDSPQTVTLAGNSTGIVLNGPHAAVDHPVVRVYSGASYDVNLSNTGNAPLAISSIALAGTSFNTQTNNCPSSLNSGTSCTISIHSVAPGADQLSILTNDPGFSSDILIFQPPNAPAAVFTPSNLLFADTATGSTKQFTYTFDASATVTPTVTGPQASEFTVTAPVCGMTTEFSPQGCTSKVSFSPLGTGLRTAKLMLDSTGNYLPLAGMATSPSHSSLSQFYFSYFPYYPIPQVSTLGYNSSSVPSIAIQSVTGPTEYTETNNCGSSPSQTSCSITVFSTRRSEGGTQALLTITTGSDVHTYTLDDSSFPMIDFGDTTINSPATQKDSFPIPTPIPTYPYNYASVFGDGLAEYPWTSFAFAGCSAQVGSCVGEYTFSPTVAGYQTGNTAVRVLGGTSAGDRQYILFGNGVPTGPAAKLLVKQTGFAYSPGSNPYSPSTLTLTNLGDSTVTTTGPTLTGADPQNFTLGQASCRQSSSTNSTYPSIAPGAQCTIPITFNSAQSGFSSAIATVTDSNSGLTFSTPLYLATLVGPAISPAALSFANTVVDTVSASQTVTVTRDPTHPVTTTTGNGLVATKGSCAAGETPCILTFVFAPTKASVNPTATINDDILGSSTTLPVSATAVIPYVPSLAVISPSSLLFAAQAPGTKSPPQVVTITSKGPGILSLYSFSLVGSITSDFAETTTCGTSLPVNASCTVSVTFNPTSSGARSALLYLNTSSMYTGTPLAVSLSGAAQ